MVRRFGLVGGMESYVWHLVNGLSSKGLNVVVVCERVFGEPSEGIRVIQVEPTRERPRWKAMKTFRARVNQAIKTIFHHDTIIVHSHERSLGHQLTTFHGSPITLGKSPNFFSKFNRRLASWSEMEIDELTAGNVQMILPVSSRVKQQLTTCYPLLTSKPFELAWPAVEPASKQVSAPLLNDNKVSSKFLFVGREWKRKGLDLAVKVVTEFRRSGINATLTIFGPEKDQLPRSIRSLDWIEVMGWSTKIPWSKFSLLIHPARNEPFGMVVAEARANGLPVLMSDAVGASDLAYTDVIALPLETNSTGWCGAISRVLEKATREPEIKWTWANLVDKHVEDIYPRIKAIQGCQMKLAANDKT